MGLTVGTPEDDRTRAHQLGALDQDQLVVTDPLLHDFLCQSETARLECLLALQVGQTADESRSRRLSDTTKVLLLASSDGHGSCLDELLEAEIVDSLGGEDDVGSGGEDLADSLNRDVGLTRPGIDAVSASRGRG